jgi:PleD family two-component response regulator
VIIAPDLDLSIIVVDDAKVPLVVIRQALATGGYHDVRVANDAKTALFLMQERPADVVLADWLMPGMDGLELTHSIRQLDEEQSHYTYVMILTAKEGGEAMSQAFQGGADDYVPKSSNKHELLARLINAGRISRLQNTLLDTARALTEQNRELVERSAIDTLTGVSTRAYFLKRLQQLAQHTAARGGGACVAVVRLLNTAGAPLSDMEDVREDVLVSLAKRLTQTVRPLDVVARVDEETFAVLVYYPDVSSFHAGNFRRIYNALNLRAFKTVSGFVAARAAVSVCMVANVDKAPRAEDVLDMAVAGLASSAEISAVCATRWSAA